MSKDPPLTRRQMRESKFFQGLHEADGSYPHSTESLLLELQGPRDLEVLVETLKRLNPSREQLVQALATLAFQTNSRG